MKIIKPLMITALLLSSSAFASTIAIIDSGVDLNHPELTGRAWENSADPLNGIDDDRNGYKDDFNGWNFHSNNNQLINYKYQNLVTDSDLLHFMEIQEGISSIDELAPVDIEWLKNIRESRPGFFEDINKFGNYTHGTHVAGIASKGNLSEIMPIKLLPTDVNDVATSVAKKMSRKKGLKAWMMKKAIRMIAKIMGKKDILIGDYINSHDINVVNGSYGTGFPQGQQAAKILLGQISLIIKPRKKDINKVANAMIEQLIENNKSFVEHAPNSLFVFAAGNDGLNNDIYPCSPANVQAPNVISVAATKDFDSLASFSNFGEKTVDVAAPGVQIESIIPGGGTIFMSGTSQAAPYVSNVAARVKDANPSLKASQIKEIILATVTKKPFLKGKVLTGGVVNWEKAVHVSQLSNTMSVEDAIIKASKSIFPLTLLE